MSKAQVDGYFLLTNRRLRERMSEVADPQDLPPVQVQIKALAPGHPGGQALRAQ